MKKTVTLIAFAGIATAANAENAVFSIVPSVSTAFTTGVAVTLTLAVYADADFGTAIGGGGFRIDADGGIGIVTEMELSIAPWAEIGFKDLGVGGGGNHQGVIFGQLIFPPFLPAAEESLLANGPVLIANFAITLAANSSGVIDWRTMSGPASFDFDLEIYDEATGLFTIIESAEYLSTSVIVVPAPSALAMLGLGGLAASRRRR